MTATAAMLATIAAFCALSLLILSRISSAFEAAALSVKATSVIPVVWVAFFAAAMVLIAHIARAAPLSSSEIRFLKPFVAVVVMIFAGSSIMFVATSAQFWESAFMGVAAGAAGGAASLMGVAFHQRFRLWLGVAP